MLRMCSYNALCNCNAIIYVFALLCSCAHRAFSLDAQLPQCTHMYRSIVFNYIYLGPHANFEKLSIRPHQCPLCDFVLPQCYPRGVPPCPTMHPSGSSLPTLLVWSGDDAGSHGLCTGAPITLFAAFILRVGWGGGGAPLRKLATTDLPHPEREVRHLHLQGRHQAT